MQIIRVRASDSLASDTCRDLEYLVQCPKSIRRRAQCMSHNMVPLLCAFQAIKNKMARNEGEILDLGHFYNSMFSKITCKQGTSPPQCGADVGFK